MKTVFLLFLLCLCSAETDQEAKPELNQDPDIAATDKPTPTLTSDRNSVLTFNLVTLTCTVEDGTPPWNIYWYRDNQESEPVKVTDGPTYLIRGSESTNYWCRGGRGDPPNYTQYSNPVYITVSEAPVPVLSRHPDWPETFIGETLTLKCTIPGRASDWTYWWLKDDRVVSSSETSEYILGPSENPSVEYRCKGQRKDDKQYSKHSGTITVSLKDQPKATLTAEQTVIPAGGSVALSCSVEGSGWNYYWYQHSDSTGPITVSEGGQYSTGPITVSEGGVYRCRGGRGDPVYYSQFSDPLTLNTPDVKSCPSGWKMFGDRCYYLEHAYLEHGTWQGARDHCLSQGADLVVINSPEEQAFIRDYNYGRHTWSWIGLTRNGTRWTWVDGTALTTQYWRRGHPRDENEDWNCAFYWHGEDPGAWGKYACSATLHAICEK